MDPDDPSPIHHVDVARFADSLGQKDLRRHPFGCGLVHLPGLDPGIDGGHDFAILLGDAPQVADRGGVDGSPHKVLQGRRPGLKLLLELTLDDPPQKQTRRQAVHQERAREDHQEGGEQLAADGPTPEETGPLVPTSEREFHRFGVHGACAPVSGEMVATV